MATHKRKTKTYQYIFLETKLFLPRNGEFNPAQENI